jgi:hypothetical protein
VPVSERYAGIPGLEARWNAAVECVHHRRRSDTLVKRQMMDAANRYNNAVVFPVHDVEGDPEFPAVAASIIADAIDGFATRANDTCPTIVAPAIDMTAENHRKRAELRKHAWGATFFESKIDLKMARAYRQLFGYGTFALQVRPDHGVHRARVDTRDPLLAYPEPMGNDEIRLPNDIGFIYGRSPQELMRLYPEARDLIQRNMSTDDDLWDVLEWTDNDWCLVGILGKRGQSSFMKRYGDAGQVVYETGSPEVSFLVRAYPNRADVVPVVCPQAVTLDRLISSITRIVPVTDLMNKLAALDFLAAEKGVFPDLAILGDAGLEPELLGGHWKDGRSGDANLIQNAKAIQQLALGSQPQTQAQLSNLERVARQTSGNPGVFQGEASGSIRSGQTVTQLAGYSIDPRLGEAHKVMAYALGCANEAVAATELGYWPKRRYTVFSGWQHAERQVSYVPTEIWSETRQSVVAYPMPGMDAQASTVAIAQLNQARMMSRRTGMRKHQLIEDPEGEERAMIEESFDDAVLMAGVQLASSGQLAWSDLGIVRKHLRSGKMIEDAIAAAQEEAQQRQATQAPPPQPGQVAAPEAMPGLNAPEAGGQMAPAPAGGPPPDQAAQFEQVLAALMSQPGAGGGPGGAVPAGVG